MRETDTKDPLASAQVDQTDPPVYLPGTPTLSFTTYLTVIVDALRR